MEDREFERAVANLSDAELRINLELFSTLAHNRADEGKLAEAGLMRAIGIALRDEATRRNRRSVRSNTPPSEPSIDDAIDTAMRKMRDADEEQ